MGQERRLFKSEEPKQRSEVSEFLRLIAGKIEAGQVILRQGQEEIILDMPAKLILEIQVEEEDKKSKGMQHSLEIEIKWFEGDGEGGVGGSLELG
jgi:amphi-Trp domain-containing protein